MCETCGYDRRGNDAYDYAADPRPEHAVVLTWPDGETAADAIKAATAPEALEAARTNWPDATVTLTTMVSSHAGQQVKDEVLW